MFKGWGRKLEAWMPKSLTGPVAPGPQSADPLDAERNTKQVGDSAEDRALAYLERQGLRLEARNYRVAGGPRKRGGEIDLILRDRDGTLVFVEVRARRDAGHGGAAGSITSAKQQRVLRAARHYLLNVSVLPPCRFDVVAIEGEALAWLPGAFGA